MAARAYIETSMVSYLTARPSRDLVVAAHQQISADWWERRRRDFELCTSQLVVDEARRGEPEMARRRLEILKGMPLLEMTDTAQTLAVAIVQKGLLHQAAFPDALHIAIATAHQVDYLLTWNCSHIANAEILPQVARICDRLDLILPYVCTPEELLGEPQ
ncbi:MAG: type II toxin-antitoxin system VapC family toxin [bacterium]|nr:type II toxin-antitoxin system VapC family toxin [bacterium]